MSDWEKAIQPPNPLKQFSCSVPENKLWCNLSGSQSQVVVSFQSQGVSKILRACRNFGQLNAIEFRIFFRRRSFNKTSELLPMGGQSCIMSIVLHRWKLEIKILPPKRGNRDWYIFTTKCVNHHLYAEEKTVQDQIIYFTQVKFHFNNISWDEISHKYNLIG